MLSDGRRWERADRGGERATGPRVAPRLRAGLLRSGLPRSAGSGATPSRAVSAGCGTRGSAGCTATCTTSPCPGLSMTWLLPPLGYAWSAHTHSSKAASLGHKWRWMAKVSKTCDISRLSSWDRNSSLTLRQPMESGKWGMSTKALPFHKVRPWVQFLCRS